MCLKSIKCESNRGPHQFQWWLIQNENEVVNELALFLTYEDRKPPSLRVFQLRERENLEFE
jgi:hypothetical protein